MRPRETPLAPAVFLATAGASSIFLLPSLVGVLAQGDLFSARELGILSAVDIVTMSIVLLALAPLAPRLRLRALSIGALVLIAAGNAATAWTSSLWTTLPTRVASGAGEGFAMAVGFVLLGARTQTDRAFGINFAVGCAFGAAGLSALPYLAGAGGRVAVFGSLAVAALMGLPLACQVPRATARADVIARAAARDTRHSSLIAFGLTGVLVYFIAQGAVWGYMERIGAADHLSAAQIGGALSLSSVAGLGGAGLAAIIGARYGRLGPIALASMATLTSIGVLLHEVTLVQFAVAAAVFNFCWNFCQSLFGGLMAALDPAGRAVVVTAALMTGGTGLGPIVAALAVSDSAVKLPVALIGGLLTVLAVGLTAAVTRKLQRESGGR